MIRVLILVAFFSSLSIFSWAESAPSPGVLVSQIKSDVTNLLQENYALRAQHDQLKDEYVALLRRVNAQKSQLKEAGIISDEWVATKEKKKNMIDELKTSAAAVQNEILLQESKNSFLKAELYNLDEKQSLLDLKHRDVQIQQKELQMELQLKRLAYENRKKEATDELETLKVKVQETSEKEKALIRQINQLNHQSIDFDAEISRLEKENKEKKEELASLTQEKEFQLKENSILHKKQLLFDRTTGGDIGKLAKEEALLQDEVKELTRRRNELDQALTISLEGQSQTRQYLKDVKRIDEENQFLRTKIDSLTKKIQSIGY